jgi:hypothetical protein
VKCFCGLPHHNGESEVVAQNESKNEAEVRRFLLGEMSADERDAFEENFVMDDVSFEQIRVVEDELIESHVRGTLPSGEKEKFERSFLTTERRRNRVAFTRTMLDKLAQEKEIAVSKKTEMAAAVPSVWDSIAGLFKTPQLALGVAFALLLLVFSGWLLLRPANKTEIVQQITPTPTVRTTPPNQNQSPHNENALPDANGEAPDKKQNSDTQKQDSTGVAPVLALFAGAVRGEGKLPELNLPKNAAGANLQLNIARGDYKSYSVEIVDADGHLILKKNKLKANNSKISLFVPAAKLRGGDYMVKLSALNLQNKNESLADYTFRVNRK